MARVTVEDCVLKVPNRFDLVMLSAQRARDISAGATLTVERDNDKNPVVALREIAEATVDHLGQHSRSVLPAQGAPELIRSASQYLERWHGRGAATTYRAAARLHWMQGARRGRRDAAAPAALGAVLRRREVAPA